MKVFILPTLAFVAGCIFCSMLWSADDDLQAQLEAATRKITSREYLLKYKFRAGETIRWQVLHNASTETRIQGNTQTSQARSKSIKLWKITDVDAKGQITFIHMIESVDMWQKLSDQPELSYNSRTDRKPPLLYEDVADTVGKPIARITITPYGEIVKRDNKLRNPNFGVGEITLRFPEKPVKIGSQWYAPNKINVRLKDKRVLPVKVRHKHTLRDVKNNIATIRVETEVLTPGVNRPSIRSQLIQQMTEGVIFFDIEKGRVLRKILDWNENVVGFSGPDSSMRYIAQFKEELIPSNRTARSSSKANTQ